jgi:hypothetical protein
LDFSQVSTRFIHDENIMDSQNSHRRPSLVSDRSIAIGVELEKEWDQNLDKRSTSESSSIQEPEKVRTRDEGVEDSAPRHHDPEGTPVHRTVTAQDWTGPDDPENPHNWPIWKRVWHTIPPALLAFIV